MDTVDKVANIGAFVVHSSADVALRHLIQHGHAAPLHESAGRMVVQFIEAAVAHPEWAAAVVAEIQQWQRGQGGLPAHLEGAESELVQLWPIEVRQ